jgi:para-aminobenzoate synthetase component I
MKALNKAEAMEIMNRLGAGSRPFLFLIGFDNDENYVLQPDAIDSRLLRYNINAAGEKQINPKRKRTFTFSRFPMPAGEYNKAFELVMDEIRSGNTYLLNLTFPTRIETDLSLEEIYEMANTTYKVWFHKRFVVFSPESFVRIHNGKISSFPMKGTLDASVPNAERIIMEDPKETAEHATIVDLIRNDLSIVAKNVRVSRFRFIDRIQTNFKDLLQVSSEITGELNTDYKQYIGNIMFSLLPAGSVTGAPKKKTLEIIRKAENYQRGFYTGICGFFDGQNLDSGVMIRFIEQAGDGTLYYKSGGGITAFSNAEKEYNELIDKVYVPFI